MAGKPYNPHEWFTAGEAAEIASACGIAGLPATRWGMTKLIRRDSDAHESGRRRAGQKGGGGTEYHWSLFPVAIHDELAMEALRRTGQIGEEPEPAFAFTVEDEQLMAEMLGILRPRTYWLSEPKRFSVRRGRITSRGYAWWLYDLAKYEGQRLAVTWTYTTDRPAFFWRCAPGKDGQLIHGELGFVGMAYPDLKPGRQ